MAKRILLRVVTALVLLLLLATGIWYFFAPKKAAGLPDFPPMPTDTAGYNLIGNLPENLEAGGFMAGQNGWIYYANFADGGALYMCRENGGDMTKITDFPVCNINVMGTSLVFTGLERYGSFYHFDVDPADPAYCYTSADTFLGGKLYAIYGLGSSGKLDFCAIDPSFLYFSPYLDRDGLYATYGAASIMGAIVNKFSDAEIVVAQGDDFPTKRFSSGSMIYTEITRADEKNQIMRIDAKSLMPFDYINGSNLYRSGKNFVFHAKDGFIYEITTESGDIKPISSMPVESFEMNQFGEIIAYTDLGRVIISKEQWYNNIAQALRARRESQPITLQNGWYNYINADQWRYLSPAYFRANDRYYALGEDWSEPWLNVKLDTKPLVSLEDLTVEDTFTPPWLDYNERIEPAEIGNDADFGSERLSRASTDNRADASGDAQNALDATLLLLSGDESIADKYTGESVEKLRACYGASLDEAVDEAAGELANTLSSKLGTNIIQQEARDVLTVWLGNSSYYISGARVASNGGEATVTLTVNNFVDLDLLYSAIQGEDDADFLEIVQEPERYGFMSSLSSDMQVYMKMTSDGCWAVENPGALIRGLLRDID